MAELSIEELEKFLPRNLAQRVAKEVSKFATQAMSPAVKQDAQTWEVQESKSNAVLIVDRTHRGTIEFRGKTVKLTSKQFGLLAALAESPGRCVSYDVIYRKTSSTRARSFDF